MTIFWKSSNLKAEANIDGKHVNLIFLVSLRVNFDIQKVLSLPQSVLILKKNL